MVVYNAYGELVWCRSEQLMGMGCGPNVPSGGGSNVSVPYEGPLETGMYYQFRVSAWREPGMGDAAPISTTEDLRGVFFLPAD